MSKFRQRSKISSYMKSSIIWSLFFTITAFLAFILSYQTAKELYFFLNLNKEKIATITKWTISSEKEKKFYLTAHYTFDFADKTYDGKTRFSYFYLNLPSAQDALKEIAANEQTIYFDSQHPQRSTLEKNLPIKKSFYTLITLSVFFYFILLRKKALRFL